MNSKLSRAYYFAHKALKDFYNPLIYNIHEENQTGELREYYFVFDRDQLIKGGSYVFDFDSEGIPMIQGHIADTDGSYFYYPPAIGQFALAVYHDYLDQNKNSDKELFLRLSDWFVENTTNQDNSDVVYWPDNLETKLQVYDENKIQKISSMSQSRVISVLLRAYQLTDDEKYSEIADQAVLAYQNEPEDGGFLLTENDLILFEEPNQAKVLNHLIFSIFGLYDYCRHQNFETELYALCEQSLASVKSILPNYNTGWWSLYDDYYVNGQRRINPCTRHYHNIHIQQLMVLFSITQDPYFKKMADKWRDYDESIIKRLRMLYHKSKTVKKMNRL